MKVASKLWPLRSTARALATSPENILLEHISVRLVCFGSGLDDQLASDLPGIQQILLGHVIAYLEKRFCTGCYQITREHWDADLVEFAGQCETHTEEQLLVWAGGKVQ